jgi:hypothetical protein
VENNDSLKGGKGKRGIHPGFTSHDSRLRTPKSLDQDTSTYQHPAGPPIYSPSHTHTTTRLVWAFFSSCIAWDFFFHPFASIFFFLSTFWF